MAGSSLDNSQTKEAIKQLINICLVKFGCDLSLALNLTNILSVLFIQYIDISYYFQSINIVYISLCISAYFIYTKWKNPFNKKSPSKKTIVVKGLDPCNTVLTYIKRNPLFYDKTFIAIIDESAESRSFLYPGSSIKFNDTNHNITGFVHGRKETVNVTSLIPHPTDKELKEKTVATENVYIEIEILSGILSPIEYFEKIKEENKKMFSITCSETIPNEIMEKPIISSTPIFPDREVMKTEFIDSFFSPEKDRIWNIVSMIHYNPDEFEKYGQAPCFNALLYGPPGSGKSSFAYRIARALGRNINNVNLHKFVVNGTVSSLKKLLCYNQNIEKTVFIFDELDEAILYIREQKLKKTERAEEKSERPDKNDPPLKLKIGSNNEITMEDLLSIFQGAVPVTKRIIFATTNNYEKLRDISPALFRPGRLTPIHFDYLDWTRLNELSMFYFSKSLSFPTVEKCHIPTSEIIELAMSHVSSGSFEKFQSELHAKLVK